MTIGRTCFVALLVVVALASCSKKEEAPAPKLQPISESEEKRGHDACTAYIERLCRCAETRTELKEECELIRHARIEALRKALAASRDERADDHQRWRTEITARRIISRCVEEDNKLDLAICPR